MSNAVLACPICGNKISNEELRLHRNIAFCDTGAVALGPTELTIVNMLLRNLEGLDTNQIGDRIGLDAHGTNVTVIRVGRKLADIGWTVRNIGCGGRGGALYVLQRKYGSLAV